MAFFGINIEKVDERLDPWVNTYYCQASTLVQPIALADYLGAGEQMVHSDLVSITGAHIWQVGVPGNFSNQTYGYQGSLSSGNALPAWFTAEVTMLGDGGYPGYKRFRGRYAKDGYDGPDWATAILIALGDFADYLAEAPISLTTRSGIVFTSFGFTTFPKPHQLGKKWYNRTP